MKQLSYIEIRKKYLDFFKKNNHSIIPSASLVPENDPSTLFVNSGMFPLVPFLLGEKHPAGDKLANSQRCIRTIDIEEVGNTSHCTSFEMLGNWSLNDYFKKEAINFTISFFVDELGMDINRIYATVFKGDQDAPEDTESIKQESTILEVFCRCHTTCSAVHCSRSPCMTLHTANSEKSSTRRRLNAMKIIVIVIVIIS